MVFLFNNYGISLFVNPIKPFLENSPILRLPNNATFTPALAVLDVADLSAPGGRRHALIAGGSDGNLYQIDLTQPLDDSVEFSQFNGVLYVGASDGKLYSLEDASGNTPATPWHGRRHGGWFCTGPVAENAGGSLIAFSLSLNGENSVCVV